MATYTWKEKLQGEAYNTWLYPSERDKILSEAETLNEEGAKKIYFEVKAKIEDRLHFWEGSL